MKTKTPTFKKLPIAEVVADAMTTVTEFDWHDVFYAGEHTAMSGETIAYSNEDLQQVVDNFTANTAPLVIGHPKTNLPAHGWVSDIRLNDDNRLEIKAQHVNVEFAKAVAAKAFPNRSISLVRTKNGLKLNHIGYLGAQEPALEGLGWQFSADESEQAETIEFSLDSHHKRSVLDMFSNMRDFFIEKFSLEDADRVFPEWSLNWLRDNVVREEIKDDELHPEFSKPQTEEPDVSKYTQEQLDAAKQEAEEAAEASYSAEISAANARADAAEQKLEENAFAARLANCLTLVDKQVEAGVLTPATAEGLAEFMASLPKGEGAETFSFAKADKSTVEQSQYDFAKGFVEGLGQKSPVGDVPDLGAEQDLDEKAEAYAKANGVCYADAVLAVSEGA